MPDPWPLAPLGEIATPIERTEVPVPGTVYRQVGVKLWGQGAYEREALDGAETRYKTLSRVEAGDIIVNKIWARNGSVAVIPEPLAGGFVSGEFPTFVPGPAKLDPRWFHWFTRTRSCWEQCDEKSRGTSGKNRIRPERFLEIKIPLPPLDEQWRIVVRIEQLAAKIEEARDLRHKTALQEDALVDQERAVLFIQASKEGTVRLEDAAALERGKFSHRPRNDPRFFGGGHPWIQIEEIESSDKYIRKWSHTLNDAGLAISRKFPKGTLLISIAATIGAVGILDFDCCIPDSVVAVIPKPGFDSEYVYHYLLYVRHHLEALAPQSAQKNINLRILSPLPIPIPPPPEQRRIVAYLDDLQAKVDALKKLQAETTAELDALLPSVLDRAFRGEL
jgi:type I restriction enzyme, S subunit